MIKLGSFNTSGGVGIWVIPSEIGVWLGFEWCGGKILDMGRGGHIPWNGLGARGISGIEEENSGEVSSKSCNSGVPLQLLPNPSSQLFLLSLTCSMECQEGGNGVSLLDWHKQELPVLVSI